MRRRRCRATTKRCSTRRRSSAGWQAIEARRARVLRHRDDEPRSDAGADRRTFVRDRARARVLHPARASLSRRARPAAARRDARAARAVVRRSGAKEGRAERQVRPARARQPRPRRSPASRTTRCSSRTCSRRTGRTTWTISRGGISNVKTITYAEVAGKGAKQIGFDQVEHRRRHRAIRPRMPTSRCSSTGTSIRASPPTRSSTTSTRRSRCRCARCCSDGARRRDARRGAARRAEPRAGREGDGARAAGLSSSPASRSISVRRSSWARSCSSKMKLPTLRKTATGQPSTDEDVLTELAADYPLPKVLLEHRALSKLKSTYTDKLPQMVNARTGPRAHDVQPGDGGDGPARVDAIPTCRTFRCARAEGRRIREAFIAPPGHVDRLGRLFADRAADHGAPVRATRRSSRRFTKAPTSTARPPPRSSACRSPR